MTEYRILFDKLKKCVLFFCVGFSEFNEGSLTLHLPCTHLALTLHSPCTHLALTLHRKLNKFERRPRKLWLSINPRKFPRYSKMVGRHSKWPNWQSLLSTLWWPRPSLLCNNLLGALLTTGYTSETVSSHAFRLFFFSISKL